MLFVLVLLHPRTIAGSTVTFGVIHNASLRTFQGNTVTINGSCQACLCALVANPSLFSFNCFVNNLTCEMHSKVDQDKAFTLTDSAMSEYHFTSLPTDKEGNSIAISVPEVTTTALGK